MAVVQDIISSSLRKIGVLAAGESPDYQDSADALECLNDLIDQWAAENLQIYAIVPTLWTITSGTQIYAVGPGQVVNRARPVFVTHINFRDTVPTPDIELPLEILTEDAWALIPQKAMTSVYPQSVYYAPVYPYGLIHLWPVPTGTTLQGVLYAPLAITEFASLTTAFDLPPAYRRMIRNNLALELAPEYGRQPDGALIQAAMESKATVKRANNRPMDLSFDHRLPSMSNGRWYDIGTG